MATRRTSKPAGKRARKNSSKSLPQERPRKQCKTGADSSGFPARQINADEIYTDEVVAKLAADFKISDPNLVREFRACLIDAATKYVATRTSKQGRERLKRLKRTFGQLRNILCALDSKLIVMSDEERSRLWDDRWGEGEMPAFVYQQHPTTSIPKEYSDERAFRATLARLIARAGSMHTGLNQSKDVGGAPQNVALLDWVARMRDFWINSLGKKFTYSAFKDAPKSPAYKFCEAAIKPLEPFIGCKNVSTAIREVIKPLQVHWFVQDKHVKTEKSQKPRPARRKVSARKPG